MSELLIRPAHNDHRLVETLLSTSGGVRKLRRPISRLVLDAPVAAKQPVFVEAAKTSGTPVLIDPLTFFLQDEVAVGDPWERLPFGRSGAILMTELEDPKVQEEITANVVDFELDFGATAVVAPYILLGEDPRAIEVSLNMLSQTRSYMESRDIQLPLVAIVALPTSKRVAGEPRDSTLEKFAAVASSAGADNVALAVSGTGGADDRLHHVQTVLHDTEVLTAHGASVIAWRQGLIGPCAVASGAIGYESGIGTRERCDLTSLQRNRRPGRPKSGHPRGAGVFIQPFGRSVARPVAAALLDNQKLRPRLVCDSEQCCPQGVESMLEDNRRHAVIARSRGLVELDRMPSRDWRLNAVARNATNGAVLADLATLVLHESGARDVVNSSALGAIAIAADLIREDGGRAAS
jgi:hypothetical protein